jgi:hypothetical protein
MAAKSGLSGPAREDERAATPPNLLIIFFFRNFFNHSINYYIKLKIKRPTLTFKSRGLIFSSWPF